MTRRPVSRYQRFDRVGRDRDFRCWHETDMPTTLRDVRFQGQSGKHMLAARSSGFDPNLTLEVKLSHLLPGALVDQPNH